MCVLVLQSHLGWGNIAVDTILQRLASPSIFIAHDRHSQNIVAHEIAHIARLDDKTNSRDKVRFRVSALQCSSCLIIRVVYLAIVCERELRAATRKRGRDLTNSCIWKRVGGHRELKGCLS